METRFQHNALYALLNVRFLAEGRQVLNERAFSLFPTPSGCERRKPDQSRVKPTETTQREKLADNLK